jgi:hypothetical protein
MMTEYLIFAHKSYEQPLELLGTLRGEGEAEMDHARLVEEACAKFGSEEWIEMIAIPKSAVVQVIPISESLRHSP